MTPLVVLDTNVALALWLWRDERLAALRAALESRALLWLTDEPTWQELVHELRPQRCSSAGQQPASVLAAMLEIPPRRLSGVGSGGDQPALQCADASDQKFISLALRGQARWLLSRDKAVLKLRKKAAALTGLAIMSPDSWPKG